MTSEKTAGGRPPDPENLKTARYPVRLPLRLKAEFLQQAGHRRAAGVVVQMIRWYLRKPGAKLPDRPAAPEDAEAQPAVAAA